MARTRRPPRSERELRRLENRLKRAGVYKPRPTSAKSGPKFRERMARVLRKPGRQAVAAGEAKAVKVGRKAAKEYQAFPSARDRVIISERPGYKITVREGEIWQREVDPRTGRILPGGEQRRFTKGPAGTLPEDTPGWGYVVTVNDNPSIIFFQRRGDAERHMQLQYRRAMRAQRDHPGTIVVRVDRMRKSNWDEIMENRDARASERRRRDAQRHRERRALRRSIRPFR